MVRMVRMVRMVELNVSAADVLQCMCAHVYLLVPMYVCILAEASLNT